MEPKRFDRRDLIWAEDDNEIHPLQRGKRGIFRVLFSRAFFIALFLLMEFVLVFLATAATSRAEEKAGRPPS